MKRNKLLIILVGVIISIILLCLKLYSYLIVSLTLTIIGSIYVFKDIKQVKTPENTYEKEINSIIKTYEPLLVEIKKLPEFDVKNIIVVSSFEKLIDIQYEMKKPILYKKELESYSFILMDSEIAYVYIKKLKEDSYASVDDTIKLIELNTKKRNRDKKTLEDLDETTIIKLDDDKEYKVSPIRKKEFVKEIKVEKEEKQKVKIEETLVEEILEEDTEEII